MIRCSSLITLGRCCFVLPAVALWLGTVGSVRAAGVPSENRLSAFSALHIATADEPQETGDFQLDSRGDITLMYAGRVHLAGLTVPQAQDVIVRALKRYIRHPQVVVTLVSAGAYRITGAVRQPAEYSLPAPNFTLADAIGRAGGIADRARLKETTIIRRLPDGRSQVIKLDARSANVQASTLIRRDDDITIPVGSPGFHPDPLTVIGTVIGLGGLMRR